MKAILILEMPESCIDCPLCQYDSGEEEQFCGADEMARTLRNLIIRRSKPSWCPLKEMPKERVLPTMEVQNTNYGEEPWFSDGWNACLEEINK